MICLHVNRDIHSAMALTHIELLLGCAVPVWMWCTLLVMMDSTGSHDVCTGACPLSLRCMNTLRLLPHMGWITVGLGDAMVSVCVSASLLEYDTCDTDRPCSVFPSISVMFTK